MCYNVEQVKIKIEKMINRGYISQDDFDKMPDNWVLKGFTYPTVKVITNVKPFLAKDLQWGLIPHWANNSNAYNIRSATLNAKSETLLDKPSFNKLIGKKHCLIPVSGFYEWQSLNKSKYPHYIYMKNMEPFMLAGLWDSWMDSDTMKEHKTFTILTCEANTLMKKIHNTKQRMPVIINEKDEKHWLEANTFKELTALCKPYNDSKMTAHSIDKKIITDKVNYNIPRVNKHVFYPELNQKSLFD